MATYTDEKGEFIFRKSYKGKNGKIYFKRKGAYKIYIRRIQQTHSQQR